MSRRLPNKYRRAIKARKQTARQVQKISYQNRTAILTQDDFGRVKILSEEQPTPGVSIRSNAAIIMDKVIFQPPYMDKQDADYLRQNMQPLISDPDRLRPVY